MLSRQVTNRQFSLPDQVKYQVSLLYLVFDLLCSVSCYLLYDLLNSCLYLSFLLLAFGIGNKYSLLFLYLLLISYMSWFLNIRCHLVIYHIVTSIKNLTTWLVITCYLLYLLRENIFVIIKIIQWLYINIFILSFS